MRQLLGRYESNMYIKNITISVSMGIALTQVAAAAGINETTSFVKQSRYRCTMATTDGLKPYPTGIDHFRMSSLGYGIADLYGDGTIDMVFGASDETFSTERVAEGNHPIWMYEGNEKRSRSAYQYAFYSPSSNFVIPNGTNYRLARTIIAQDYNGDGIDDLALTMFGTDYEPYIPARNEILLSTSAGYKAGYLPGSALHNHGGAAGDIDGDGDIDIIIDGAERGFGKNHLTIYTNDGSGNFSYRRTKLGSNYTGVLALYDLDNDNNLDIIATVDADWKNRLKGLQIFWGKGNGYFSRAKDLFFEDGWKSEQRYKRGSKDTYIRYKNWDFREPAIADIDGDGKINILVPGSIDGQERIYDIELNGRRIESTKLLWSQDHINKRPIYLHWLTACKLKDEHFDLISEVFGQYHYENFAAGEQHDLSRTDKLLFKNDGEGNLSFFKLENPDFLDEKYYDLVNAYADYFGVSVKPYIPKQVYYPNNLDERLRFKHPYYRKRMNSLPYNTVPSITQKYGFKLPKPGTQPSQAKKTDPTNVSDRVKKLIEARRKSSN